jgi:hypothetical protein
MNWAQWLTPVIPATWEARAAVPKFEVSLGKKLMRSNFNH